VGERHRSWGDDKSCGGLTFPSGLDLEIGGVSRSASFGRGRWVGGGGRCETPGRVQEGGGWDQRGGMVFRVELRGSVGWGLPPRPEGRRVGGYDSAMACSVGQ